MVLNTGPRDWESSALTIRPLLHDGAYHLFNRYYRLAKSSQEESDSNKVWGYNVAHYI